MITCMYIVNSHVLIFHISQFFVIANCYFTVSHNTNSDKVGQWLAAGRWFSPGTLVSSTNKTDRHDITEILLKCKQKAIGIH